MAEYITLTCPSCGSKLNITENIDRFACSHCGNEHIVNRGDGVVTISPIVEGLEKVQRGTDKTASELAIKRLKPEIAELELRNPKIQDRFNNRFITVIGLWLLSGVVIILPALVCALSTEGATVVILAGALIILTIGVGVFYSKHEITSIYEERLELEEERLELEGLINRKKAELRKHLDEVSD
ncbi:hypothetical protein ACFLUA_01230 [Chloroflexota bacterium]